MECRIQEFQEAVEQDETKDRQFRVAARGADRAAKQHGKKVKSVVDGQVGEVLNELREMRIGEEKEAISRKTALDLAISEMTKFVESSIELRKTASSCDIISAAKYLQARANRLLEVSVSTQHQLVKLH